MVQDRMIAQLAQCEFAMKKSDFAAKMMKQELKNYETISDTIESVIKVAKRQIDQSKESLVMAKKIRKNRMEYDVLAKVINQQPDRKNTVQELGRLKEELNQLEEKKSNLEKKLEMKKKDFTVLMRSIVELQNKLDAGDDLSQMDSKSLDSTVEYMETEDSDEKILSESEYANIQIGEDAQSDEEELVLSSPEKL